MVKVSEGIYNKPIHIPAAGSETLYLARATNGKAYDEVIG